MSGDSRKLQILGRRANGVSRAVWPVKVQRCIMTSRAAQHRRSIVMRGIWWSSSKSNACKVRLRTFYRQHALILATLYSHLLVALLAGSLVLAIYIQYQLAALLIILALCIVTTMITTRLLSERKAARYAASIARPARTVFPRQLPQPMSLDFPQTPMPATPLIRVLETIDLSSSGVEHFIAALPTTQLPEALPMEDMLASTEPSSQTHLTMND